MSSISPDSRSSSSSSNRSSFLVLVDVAPALQFPGLELVGVLWEMLNPLEPVAEGLHNWLSTPFSGRSSHNRCGSAGCKQKAGSSRRVNTLASNMEPAKGAVIPNMQRLLGKIHSAECSVLVKWPSFAHSLKDS